MQRCSGGMASVLLEQLDAVINNTEQADVLDAVRALGDVHGGADQAEFFSHLHAHALEMQQDHRWQRWMAVNALIKMHMYPSSVEGIISVEEIAESVSQHRALAKRYGLVAQACLDCFCSEISF